MHIETVDYQADDAAISLQRSLRDTGFAVLANHPIAPDRLARLYDLWGDFFASDAKHNYTVQPPRHDGFFPFRSENAKDSPIKDLKEFFHIYPASPVPDSLQDETRAIYRELVTLGTELLRWIQTQTPADIATTFTMPLDAMMYESQESLLRILH